jgi:uncharacterized protein (DUF885 family)
MRLLLIVIVCLFSSITVNSQSKAETAGKMFSDIMSNYYEQGLRMNPISATMQGDARYNDLLVIPFTESYRDEVRQFYQHYTDSLREIKPAELSSNDQLSYMIIKRECEIGLEGLDLKTNRLPANQFQSFALLFAQLGSGTVQPFKTVNDYRNWIKRASGFSAWVDSAITYFRMGMQEHIVLPRILVVKMMPQMDALVSDDISKSVFYLPLKMIPDSFSTSDKESLRAAIVSLITDQINPAYRKLSLFLKNEYLPFARLSNGYSDLPDGKKIYDYLVKVFTTTNKSSEEIYNTGILEVARIRQEMEKVKKTMGYKGSMADFFNNFRTDSSFYPYSTPEQVLDAYRSIQAKITPYLSTLFIHAPSTPFEIRQTESFRAASAAAQYFPGSPLLKRPGIFYVPIVDARKTQRAVETLFIHEAIPGHHYQAMLQRENDSLPPFRKYSGNTAYIEGWGLYSESLGKQLGCFGDPYQYMMNLGDEMLRAVRLVVDPGLHVKGWTREKAIQYMMDNEPISEHEATTEVERYMANPGQALAYKTGSLKIQELKARYIKQLGKKFNIALFHDQILKDGALPLAILEQKMDTWASGQN